MDEPHDAAVGPDEQTPAASSVLAVLPHALVLLLASVLVTGYSVYVANHSHQMTLVDRLHDPSAYPNDVYVGTLRYYCTLVWYAFAAATRVVAREPLLLALFLFERACLLGAAAAFAQAVAPGSRLAMVGAMALVALGPEPLVATGTLVVPYFEQTGLSIPFFLLALAALHRRKPIAWAVWLALGANCNVLYGGYAVVYSAAAWLADPEARQAWRRWAAAGALLVVLSAPSLALMARTLGSGTSYDRALWLLATRVRYSIHLYPATWGLADFARYGALLLLVVGLLHSHRQRYPVLWRHLLAWSAAGVGWILLGFAAAAAGSPFLLTLHPARATDIWYLPAGIGLVAILAAELDHDEAQRPLLAAAWLAAIFLWRPFAAYAVLVAVIAVATPTLRSRLLGERATRLPVLAVALVVLMGLWCTRERMNGGGLRQALYTRPAGGEAAIASWARTASPAGAVMVVPPSWQMLRPLAHRPVFTTWRDGDAILWQRSFVGTWAERMAALGIDLDRMPMARDRAYVSFARVHALVDGRYEALRDDGIASLHALYRVDYWVVKDDHPTELPVVHRAAGFKVLDLSACAP